MDNREDQLSKSAESRGIHQIETSRDSQLNLYDNKRKGFVRKWGDVVGEEVD